MTRRRRTCGKRVAAAVVAKINSSILSLPVRLTRRDLHAVLVPNKALGAFELEALLLGLGLG